MEKVRSLTIELKPKLTVGIDTARACVKLLNWFLESNEGYRLELVEGDEGVEWALTGGPAKPGLENE